MIRRTVLAALAPFAFVAMLVGCAGTTSVTPYQVITDANTLIVALKTSTQALAAQVPPAIPADQAARIEGLLEQAQVLTNSLSGSTAATAAAPVVQQIETDLNGVVTTLAGMHLPAPYGTYVQAAAVLLPVLEAFVTSVSGAPVHPVAATAPGGMTPDHARLILGGSLAR